MASLTTTKSRLSILTGLSCFLLIGAGASAGAQTTLDFENLPNPDSPLGYNGQVGQQNGFTLNDFGPIFGGLHSVSPDGAAEGYNYTGSVALFNGSTNGSETLTQDNSNPFSVNSIDIANLLLQSNTPGGVTVTLTGNEHGGGTASTTFTHAADDSLTTVVLDSSFTNLDSFTINQTAPYNQFDNIVIDGGVTSTPEPGTFALMSVMATCGLALARRRRRKV